MKRVFLVAVLLLWRAEWWTPFTAHSSHCQITNKDRAQLQTVLDAAGKHEGRKQNRNVNQKASKRIERQRTEPRAEVSELYAQAGTVETEGGQNYADD